MSATTIQPPFPLFADTDGQPLENGYVWIGTANLDPQVNPITAYWDAALTIPAPQPIRTLGGYPVRSGTPARLYTNSSYSIRVQDKNGITVYNSPDNDQLFGGTIGADSVMFLQSGAAAQERTVESKLQDVVSFEDFGAVGNDSADCTAEIQAAIDAAELAGGGTVHGTKGAVYKITAPIVLKSNVLVDLAGSTIKQYINNTQIVTAPTGVQIVRWGVINGTLRYATIQDGTSTVSVTVTGALNVGDIFQGQTSGATGQVVSIVAGVMTYLAGVGSLIPAGENLAVYGIVQGASTTAPTTVKCGGGLRLANGAFSWSWQIDRLWILDAYDGISCPSDVGTFAFVGQISNYTASVARWAINYDCQSSVGANTNVTLTNCWHVHSFATPAPFASGFLFNACAMFRWESVFADKINGQLLFIQTSSGTIGEATLEASDVVSMPNNEASAVQFSDSSLTVGTLKFVGNTYTCLNRITVAVTGAINVNDIITGGTSNTIGKVVARSGNVVVFSQNTEISTTVFAIGEQVRVAGVSQGTVTALGNNGLLSLLRATSSTYNVQQSCVIDNFVTSGGVYAGQEIFEVAPTTNSVSPAAGPYYIYNKQATLDRTSIGISLTGTIAVGNTITGATSGASGVVTSVGTIRFFYTPTNSTPWTTGENVLVGGVSQGTVASTPAYPGNLADFNAPYSVKEWNGVYRWIDASGPGARIVGDLSNTTIANRLIFQSSVVNGGSNLAILPNGTSTSSGYTVSANSDPANASIGQLRATASAITLAATRTGAGTFLPLILQVNGGDDRVQVDTNGNVRAGAPSLATTATAGFLYVPTCAGIPTGVPTAITGMAPIVVNTTNNKLYFYSSGAWRDAGP